MAATLWPRPALPHDLGDVNRLLRIHFYRAFLVYWCKHKSTPETLTMACHAASWLARS